MTAEGTRNLWILRESLKAVNFLHAKNETLSGLDNERICAPLIYEVDK